MNNKDIRWIQRFSNYEKALSQLTRFIEKGELNELEEQGLIQSFEYTHELAWNSLKDFLLERNVSELYGSRDVTREAFKIEIIKNGQVWMEMIKSRNQTSHTYNEETAKEINRAIRENYFPEFVQLKEKLTELKEKESD